MADRGTLLKAYMEGDVANPLEATAGSVYDDDAGYPSLTGETVEADGKARRVALHDFDVAYRDNELQPLNFAYVKRGDVALLSQGQADRLEAAGFVVTEADYKAATSKSSRKA